MTDNQVMCELERLAAAMPWDVVELTLRRQPGGKITYSAYLTPHEQFGWDSAYAFTKDSPEQAVDQILRENQARRSPEVTRDVEIKKLEEKIAKLRAVEIGMPPYVPNRELSQFSVNRTVDV